MKKIMAYRVVSALLLIVSVTLSVLWLHTYRENKRMQSQLAADNLSAWSDLFIMTDKLYRNVTSPEEVQNYALYQNTVLYMAVDRLQPAFGSDRFLVMRYDSLMQDLALQDVSAAFQEKGFPLFVDMNAELRSVSEFVLSSVQEGVYNERDLLNPDSEISRDITEKTKAFCDAYDAELKALYAKTKVHEPC